MPGGIYSKRYLERTSEGLVKELRGLKEGIKKVATNEIEGGEHQLEKVSEEIYDKWKKVNRSWTILVLHNELDMIGVSLTSIRVNIRIGEYNRAIDEIDRTIFWLEDIVDKERVAVRNIL